MQTRRLCGRVPPDERGARRDNARVEALRASLAQAARGAQNLMPLFIECVENDVTLGEICHTLRAEWGEYRARD